MAETVQPCFGQLVVVFLPQHKYNIFYHLLIHLSKYSCSKSTDLERCNRMKKFMYAIFLCLGVSVAQAKDYKIFVPNAPGSASGDIMARAISDQYAKLNNGNKLLVANVPGGSHVIAINEYKKEPLALIVTTSTMGVFNYLQPEIMSYSDKDFNIIGELGMSPMYYFTNPTSGIKDIKDVMAPPKLWGQKPIMIGSTSTLTALSINTLKKAGAPVEAVGYKNHTEILLQVAGGHIPMGLITGGGNSLFEMAQAGKVKILGSTFVKPMNIKGIDIPSVSQQLKVAQYDGAQWLSISPGDSAEHQQLTKDIKNILASEAFQSILPGQVVFPSGSKEPPLAFIQRWRNTVVKNRDLISQ